MDHANDTPAVVEFGRFRVVPHRRELLADGRPIKLGGRDFDLLLALIEVPGAVIGKDEECGVINARHEVFGYRNLLVCDGAAVPANPGVNPSLTITAMAENAMSHIPVKAGASL